MAKKRKRKQKYLNKAYIGTAIVLVAFILSAFGIQIPEVPIPNLQNESKQSSPTVRSQNPGPQEHGSATFSSRELQDQEKGWIIYGPLDRLGRATSGDALLKKEMIGTGTAADPSIRPPGFISGTKPYFHSRGHLIGRQLGGSGDNSENLVTLYQNPVNTPYMTKYENKVRQALENNETIRYRVTPVYNEEDLMCKEIKMEAKSIGQNGTVDFNVTIINER